MNDKFDQLAKSLAGKSTRRQLLKKFSVGLAATALACFGLANKAKGNQGGCKGSDNGCKGQNSCKGKGGCASKEYKHDCAGKNACKGQGQGGKNDCKGKSGCAVPPKAS